MTDSPEDEAALDADAKAYHADDLVKRLRVGIHTSVDPLALTNESADRIEQLEAALRKIGEGDVCVSLMMHPAQCGRAYQARAALGEKE